MNDLAWGGMDGCQLVLVEVVIEGEGLQVALGRFLDWTGRCWTTAGKGDFEARREVAGGHGYLLAGPQPQPALEESAGPRGSCGLGRRTSSLQLLPRVEAGTAVQTRSAGVPPRSINASWKAWSRTGRPEPKVLKASTRLSVSSGTVRSPMTPTQYRAGAGWVWATT